MLKNLPASLKKTFLNLRSELLLAFQQLGIKADLVKTHVMFTTDCGANIVKALSLYKWVGCACHQLATACAAPRVCSHKGRTDVYGHPSAN